MILLVLGAGASYDSNPYKPAQASAPDDDRIPLANELFTNRKVFRDALSMFPQCTPLVPRLLPHGEDFSLEEQLQTLLDQAEGDPKSQQQLAAIRYYLHTVIFACESRWLATTGGSTNQVTLLDHLRRRADDGICLVTFNYDTIIEHALRSVGITINGLPSYISDSRYKLIKLHGSVDWAHPIRFVRDNRPHTEQVDEFRQWIIENIASLKVDFEAFEVTKAHPMSFAEESYPAPHRGAFIQMGTRKVGHFPAIAIPVRQKDRFECPADHVKALESCLPQVDRVLIVGWRATEVPFLNLLTAATRARRGIPQVLVVGEHRNSVEKTIANLQQAGLDGHFTSYIAGFSAFVTSQELMKFLEP